MTESISTQQQSAEALQLEWDADARWSGIARDYSAADVVRLRGSVVEERTLARRGAERLFARLQDETPVRALGALDNRFVYEGRAGREHVIAFEVAPRDAAVYATERLEGRDPVGRTHVATWVSPAALRAGAPPLYPAGVVELLRAAE